MGKYGMTLGEMIVRHQRDEDVPLPTVEEAAKLHLNRADERETIRHLPRRLRKETFGKWRTRGLDDE